MAGFDNRAGFTFGDTVLTPFAMPQQNEAVQQPGVVISSTTYNQQRTEILMMAIAVQDRPNASSGEVAIQSVESAGLDQGAALKPILFTVDQKQVRLILGKLGDRDRQSLRHLLDLIIGD